MNREMRKGKKCDNYARGEYLNTVRKRKARNV